MPVDSVHPDYAKNVDIWAKCRDVVEGEEAIHKAGPKYLPRLLGQSDDEYRAYKLRASFYNATARTLDGLNGLIFRKSPAQTLPVAMTDAFVNDVTMSGVSLLALAQMLVSDVLTTSRAAIMVDYPNARPDIVAGVAQQKAGLRPFLRLIEAEDIINWQVGQVNNHSALTQVRFKEVVDIPSASDPYAVKKVTQIRELSLTDGRYVVQLWRQDNHGVWQPQYVDATADKPTSLPLVASAHGQPMPSIPFVFVSDIDTTPAVHKPVLLDLVNINLSHYRTTADLEHGAHYCALPTAYMFGVSADEHPTAIGGGTIWVSENPNAKAGFVEFTGQGLGALERRLAAKESAMAALGARMLEPQKRMAESADALEIRSAGEYSSLASIARAVSDALQQALRIAADWMGATGDVVYELNTDYIPVSMDAPKLLALFQTLQGGGISQRTFFDNLQRGEIIRASKSFEDEQSEIQTDAPA